MTYVNRSTSAPVRQMTVLGVQVSANEVDPL